MTRNGMLVVTILSLFCILLVNNLVSAVTILNCPSDKPNFNPNTGQCEGGGTPVECAYDSACKGNPNGNICDTYTWKCTNVPTTGTVGQLSGSNQSGQQSIPSTSALIIAGAIIIGFIVLGLILRRKKK